LKVLHRSVVAVILTAGLVTPTLAADLISSFETEESLSAFKPANVTMERVQEHATEGKWSLKLLVPGSEKDTWPGISYVPANPDLSQHEVLAFDVFNPDEDGVSLSYRIDDGNGQSVFGGVGLAPQGNTTVEIWTSGLKSDLDLTNITKVYPYIRMPRRDYVLYFDNFRYAQASQRFKPMRYLETTAPVPPTEAEKARGYVLFHRHYLDMVFPTSLPRPQETQLDLKAFATPGEHEPVTVSLRALRELTDVRVSVSELKSPEGAIIPAEAATVYPVRCLDKRETYPSDYYIEDMPVLLERREGADVPAGESKRFWLDLHVPDGTAPGVYEGRVSISAEGAEATELPLALRVLPFTLSDPEGIFWGEYYAGPRMKPDDPAYRELMLAELRDMREHGMTSVGLCFGPSLEAFEITEDGVQVAYDETERYAWFMDDYVRSGFRAPVIQLSDTPQSLLGGDHALDSDEFARLYKGAWAAMRDEAKRRGWPEVIVQPVDEPGWKDQAARDRTLHLLKLLKEIPDMRTEEDGPADEFFEDIAGPYADVWNYNGGVGTPERVAQAIADGHIVTCYNNDVECYRPEMGRYAAGFYLLASGTDGIYNWQYHGWKGDPYNDQDSQHGDFLHVYPRTDKEVGGPATGWEGFREGTDDYKYCDLLRKTIARARKAGKTTEAEAAARVLADLVASIDYKPRIRRTARWEETTTDEDGVRRISGRMQVPNGWDFEDYDKARWQVADEIMKLMRAMGEMAQAPDAASGTGRGGDGGGPLLSDVRWRQPGAGPGSFSLGSRPQISIPRLQAAPEIDGHLDDAAWKDAARTEPWMRSSGEGEAPVQTQALLGTFEGALYLGFKCDEPKTEGIVARVTEDGGQVWMDDCVEMFFDGNLDQATFRQIIINSVGTVGTVENGGGEWLPPVQRAARVGDGTWYAELSVPISELGLTQTSFGLNLCRERRAGGGLELSCWSPTGGGFAQPERFGLANMPTPYIAGFKLGEGLLGRNELMATLVNEGAEPGAFRLRLRCWQGEGAHVEHLSKLIRLDPAQHAQVKLAYEITASAQPVQLELAALDGRGQALAQRSFSQQAPEPLKMALRPRLFFLEEDAAGLEATVRVSEELRKRSQLVVAVFTEPGMELIARQELEPIEAPLLSARLNVGGLGEGAYTVHVILKKREGEKLTRVAEVKQTLRKISGPFSGQ